MGRRRRSGSCANDELFWIAEHSSRTHLQCRSMDPSPSQPSHLKQPIVLFDGVCNLCHASVQFIIDRDPAGRFRFASLQSDVAKDLLAARGQKPPTGDPDSILLLEGDRVSSHSTAALRIARRLRGAWKLLALCLVVPRPVRDFVYRYIARNRYRWFGRSVECRLPSPALRGRFLS